jgi:ubiquinol-cytochrome c reductase cytochrome b subunit
MHIGRGLYYSSYKSPRVLVWSIGVIILVLMMAIAFLGLNASPKWINIITLFNESLNEDFLN